MLFFKHCAVVACTLTYCCAQVEIVEGCRLPVLRKNQEHEDEWRTYGPFVVFFPSAKLTPNGSAVVNRNYGLNHSHDS